MGMTHRLYEIHMYVNLFQNPSKNDRVMAHKRPSMHFYLKLHLETINMTPTFEVQICVLKWTYHHNEIIMYAKLFQSPSINDKVMNLRQHQHIFMHFDIK